jgi:hypothetical protein
MVRRINASAACRQPAGGHKRSPAAGTFAAGARVRSAVPLSPSSVIRRTHEPVASRGKGRCQANTISPRSIRKSVPETAAPGFWTQRMLYSSVESNRPPSMPPMRRSQPWAAARQVRKERSTACQGAGDNRSDAVPARTSRNHQRQRVRRGFLAAGTTGASAAVGGGDVPWGGGLSGTGRNRGGYRLTPVKEAPFSRTAAAAVYGACRTYRRSLPSPPIAHRFSGGFAVTLDKSPGDGRTVPSATIVPSPGDLPATGDDPTAN